MADNELQVKVRVDVNELPAGMKTAQVAVEQAAARIKAAFGSIEKAPEAVRTAFGMLSNEAAKATPNLQNVAQMMSAIGSATLNVTPAIEKATNKVESIDRAMAFAVARMGAMEAGVGGLGLALGRVASTSNTLSPILAAAFPVIGAIALFDVIVSLTAKIEEWLAKSDKIRQLWQDIDNTLAVAGENMTKSLEQVIVRTVELTEGKLPALKLQLDLITESAAKMDAVVGKAFIDLEKVLKEQNLSAFNPFRWLGEGTADLQEKLRKALPNIQEALNTEGAAAGLKKMDDLLNELYETRQKIKDQADVAEFDKAQLDALNQLIPRLELMQRLIAQQVTLTAAQRTEGQAAIAHEAAEEEKNRQAEIEKTINAIRKMMLEERSLALAEKKLADERAEFGVKERTKRNEQEIRGLIALSEAERAFEQGRIRDAEEGALAEIDIRQRQILEEYRLGRLNAAQAKVQLDMLAAQKLAIERKYIADREAQILPLLASQDKEIAAKAIEEWSKLLTRKAKAESDFAKQKQTIDNQIMTQEQKLWRRLGTEINAAFDTMIRGVLMSTQTIGQAFARLAGNMLLVITESLAKQLLKHLAHWAMVNIIQKSATLTSIADFIAGTSAKHAIAAASNVATVTGNSAVAAVAAFASVMEALPFPENVAVAPGVAAATFAEGMAWAPVAAAARGMWDVPSDMLVKVHESESIIPAHIAGPMRDMVTGGGMGGDVHLHYAPTIQALDSRDVEAVLVRERGALVKALQMARREFAF